jgi:hypothetical protein
MSRHLILIATLALVAGCDMSSLPHGNLGMPDMSGGPGFGSSTSSKSYDAPSPASGPDLSHMSCSGSSVSSSGANAGTLSSSSSCHN